VFFSISPLLIALAGYFLFGERVGPRLLVSIGLGLAGVVIIGWGDLRLRPEYLAGDLSSMLCAVLFAVYFLVAKHVRPRLPSRVYVVVVYGTACVVSFATLFALRLPVVTYSDRTWLCFVLMALVPTMVGHSSINHAVRYISASRISVATLSEPVLAGLVAFYAWGEPVSVQTAAGYVLICLSVVVLVLDREQERPGASAGAAQAEGHEGQPAQGQQ
jgi:drug/metabolite transporter (DMT)-like permease